MGKAPTAAEIRKNIGEGQRHKVLAEDGTLVPEATPEDIEDCKRWLTLRAICHLPGKRKVKDEKTGKEREERRTGMHVVFSGFNDLFTKTFGVPSNDTVNELVENGYIHSRPAKKGPVLYLNGEQPADRNPLRIMGL